jgi:uncharacterized protein YbjT (DUF2867 family)
MIVITGATGQIGSQVLARVLPSGEAVRVIARDPAKLPAGVRDRVEVIEGSYGDPQVVNRAFKDADAVFWLLAADRLAASVSEAYAGFSTPMAEAVRREGVGHVVNVSALGRGTAWADRAGFVTASMALDDLIAGTGAAFRALVMPSFMDNLLRQVQVIRQQGAFYGILSPDLKLPTVATRDIAAVAARLLLDLSWTGQAEVPVLGPEDLSSNDMAAIMSDVLGTPVRYQQTSEEAYREQRARAGMSPAMLQGVVDMGIAKNNGLDQGVVRTPEHAIETPTTFRQWCTDTLKPAVQGA